MQLLLTEVEKTDIDHILWACPNDLYAMQALGVLPIHREVFLNVGRSFERVRDRTAAHESIRPMELLVCMGGLERIELPLPICGQICLICSVGFLLFNPQVR